MKSSPDENHTATGIVSVEDASNLYRLFLLREPETPASAEAIAGNEIVAAVVQFLSSDEFEHNSLAPMRQGRLPRAAHTTAASDLKAWAAGRLSFTDEQRLRLSSARTHLQIIATVLTSRDLADIGEMPTVSAIEKISQIADSTANLEGRIDYADSKFVRGWVVHHDRRQTQLRVECWLNGKFVCSTAATVRRLDLEEQLGVDACVGFEFSLPQDFNRHRFSNVDIKDCLTGLFFASAEIMPVSEIEGDFDEIELLSNSNSNVEYDAYYNRWRRDAELGPDKFSGTGIHVVLNGLGSTANEIERSLSSIIAQRHSHFYITVVTSPANAALVLGITDRARNQNGILLDVLTVGAQKNWLQDLPVHDLADLVHVLSAGAVLHPDALPLFAYYGDNNVYANILYCDEDHYYEDEDGIIIHAQPYFKPSFDRELLIQIPYIGNAVSFRRTAWDSIRDIPMDCNNQTLQSALTLIIDGQKIHIPSLLSSKPIKWINNDNEWTSTIKSYLPTLGMKADIVNHSDILGEKQTDAIRVKMLPEACKVAVIIPTRDRIDLVRPCIDSISNSRIFNFSHVDIVVVNHQSVCDETISFLNEAQASGLINTIEYDGEFNWALMNNIAAEQCDADVLIFLNNDTIVLSPDWLDELASRALQPGVGAVGCRLLYEDGTLQHAGFVAKEDPNDFLVHEGVGEEGSDGGYLGRHALAHETVAVTGACLAVRRSTFLALGGFDAVEFPVDGNDVDFCFRARDAGYSVIYTPYATLYHLESKTRGYGATETARAEARRALGSLWRRWSKKMLPDPFYNPHFDRRGRPFSRLRPPPDLAAGFFEDLSPPALSGRIGQRP